MSGEGAISSAAFVYGKVLFHDSGAPKQTAPRHAEKAAAKPNSPKAKTTTQQRQAAAPTTKNTANASGAASAPKKSMSSRREELLKQLKAVEDAIARKRAKMT